MGDYTDDPDDWFCLIRDDQKIYGYFARDFVFDTEDERFDGPAEGRAADYCTPITPDQIVSGSMPLLDLIHLFRQHYHFFVLIRNDITHVVSFYDLDKLPVKLGLFSLIMALESELIGIFTVSPKKTEDYLSLLSAERLQKARGLCRIKYGERKNGAEKSDYSAVQILMCTTFIDRTTMFLRSHLLPIESEGVIERFLNRTHDLRNRIAHSDSILGILQTPEEFDDFIIALKEFTEIIAGLHQNLTNTQGE